MKSIAFVLVLLLVSGVFAASSTNSMSIQANGAINRNFESTWSSSLENSSISGSSGSSIVTAPGALRYQTTDLTDMKYNNFYNQTGYSEFSNGGIFTESLNVETDDPYQTVLVEHAGILQQAEIDTAKFVENANLDMGQQVAWDGAGTFTRDVKYKVIQSRYTTGKTYMLESGSSDHATVFTNQSGGALIRPEFSFIDFADSFITNDTAITNATATNETNLDSEHTGAI